MGVLAGGSSAILCSALLASGLGSLSPAVAVSSLCVGVLLGTLAGRSSRHAEESLQPLSVPDLLAFAAFGFTGLRHFGGLILGGEGRLWTTLPYNYGDLPLHWTYVQFLAGGAAFWPENPLLTGERLRYPFGVDLLTALFVQLGASMRLVLPALGLMGSALAAITLRRWGGALSVAGFLFSGGLAGFQILWTGRLEDYQAAVEWKNLFLALFVPQRGFLLALPVGLLLLWSGRERLLRDRVGLPPWVFGLLLGALPLTHLHTFAFVSVVIAFWATVTRSLGRALPALLWALAPATWSVWQVTDGFSAAALIGLQPGWTIGTANPVVFLLQNFGLFLPLALVALGLALGERGREEPLLLAPALAVFAMLFVVRLAPWAWDNTKVMLWCYLLALPAIGSIVLRRLPRAARAAAVVGLLFSGAVSVLAASVGSGPRLELLRQSEHEAVCRALSDVPRSVRVATAPVFNHPAALCGHPLVAGYPGHLWSHGLDAAEIQRRLARLMEGAPGWRAEPGRLRAGLLFWGEREREAHPDSSRPWEHAAPVLASGEWGVLYRLD